MPWHRLRNLLLGLLSLACLGFSGFVVYSLIYLPDFYEPPIGGPFVLSDATGRQVTDGDLRGSYLLIYFGYTYCPDVCPTKLLEMTRALETFAEVAPARAAQVRPVFITVDPARDTAAALAAYVTHFHPRFLALTGSERQVAAAARAYNVYYRRVSTGDGQDYLMDHASYVYLMGPDGRYVTHFAATADAAQISARLAEEVD